MDFLAEHQRMLRLAADRKLPREINEASELSVSVCRELWEAGLIDAKDACDKSGDEFLEPRITIPGREYLNSLEQRTFAASPVGKAKRIGYVLAGWIGGIATTVVAALILSRLGLT